MSGNPQGLRQALNSATREIPINQLGHLGLKKVRVVQSNHIEKLVEKVVHQQLQQRETEFTKSHQEKLEAEIKEKEVLLNQLHQDSQKAKDLQSEINSMKSAYETLQKEYKIREERWNEEKQSIISSTKKEIKNKIKNIEQEKNEKEQIAQQLNLTQSAKDDLAQKFHDLVTEQKEKDHQYISEKQQIEETLKKTLNENSDLNHCVENFKKETEQFIFKINRLEEDLSQALSKQAELNEIIISQSESINQKEKENQELTTLNDELTTAQKNLQAEYRDALNQHNELKTKHSNQTNSFNSLFDSHDKTEEALSKEQEKNNHLKAQIDQLTDNKEEIEKNLNQALFEKSKLNEELLSYSDLINQKEKENQELTTLNDELTTAQKNLQEEHHGLFNHHNELKEELTHLNDSCDSLSKSHEKVEKELSEEQEKNNNLKAQIDQLKTRLRENLEINNQKTKTIEQGREEHERLHGQLNQLKKDNEGSQREKEDLLLDKEKLKKLNDILTDDLKVMSEQFNKTLKDLEQSHNNETILKKVCEDLRTLNQADNEKHLQAQEKLHLENIQAQEHLQKQLEEIKEKEQELSHVKALENETKRHLKTLENKYHNLESDYQKTQSNKAGLQLSLDALRQENEYQQQKIKELITTNQNQRQALNDSEVKLQEKIDSLDILEEKNSDLESQLRDRQKEIVRQISNNNDLKAANSDLQKNCNHFEQSIKSLEDHLSKEIDRSESLSSTNNHLLDKIESHNEHIEKIENENTQLTIDLTNTVNKLNSLEKKLPTLEAAAQNALCLKQELQTWKKRSVDTERLNIELTQQVNNQLNDIEQYKTNIQKLTNGLNSWEDRCRQYQNDYMQTKESLNSMAQDNKNKDLLIRQLKEDLKDFETIQKEHLDELYHNDKLIKKYCLEIKGLISDNLNLTNSINKLNQEIELLNHQIKIKESDWVEKQKELIRFKNNIRNYFQKETDQFINRISSTHQVNE